MTREINILTPENVELRFELAGLGSRFLAMIIDSLLQGLAILLVLLVCLAVPYTTHTVGLDDLLGYTSPWLTALVVLLVFALWAGYFLFFEATRNGQTPGKKSVGIRVIRDTGHPVDFRSAMLRNLMRAVDILPGMYGLGIVSIFVSPQYRRLGDYVGGTLVVKMRREDQTGTAGSQAASQPASASEPPLEAGARSLNLLPDELLANLHLVTKDDYRTIRHFLDRRRDLDQAVAARLAAGMAGPLASRLGAAPESVGDPADFLNRLAGEWERRMIH